MKFKVGDRVKVRENLESNKYYGEVRFDSDMERWRGKTVTIEKTWENNRYSIKEDFYLWTDEMFESIDYTYEDLKKSPIGTKITFENGAVLVKDEENYFENVSRCRDIDNLYNLKDNYSDLGKIIKIEEPEYKTVYETKGEILDEAEKRYLRGVIRPFRDKVTMIRKLFSPTRGKYYIQARYKDDTPTNFPYFDDKTMYQGMEKDKEYTLEELGL